MYGSLHDPCVEYYAYDESRRAYKQMERQDTMQLNHKGDLK